MPSMTIPSMTDDAVYRKTADYRIQRHRGRCTASCATTALDHMAKRKSSTLQLQGAPPSVSTLHRTRAARSSFLRPATESGRECAKTVWEHLGYVNEDAALASAGPDHGSLTHHLSPANYFPWDTSVHIPLRGALHATFNNASPIARRGIAQCVEESTRRDFNRFRRDTTLVLISTFRAAYRQRAHVFWAFVIVDLVARILDKATVARALDTDGDFASLHIGVRRTWRGVLRGEVTHVLALEGRISSSELAKRIHCADDQAKVIAWCVSIGCALAMVHWDFSTTDDDPSCVICKDSVPDMQMIPCEHVACCSRCVDSCIEREGRERLLCPLCRAPVFEARRCATKHAP